MLQNLNNAVASLACQIEDLPQVFECMQLTWHISSPTLQSVIPANALFPSVSAENHVAGVVRVLALTNNESDGKPEAVDATMSK